MGLSPILSAGADIGGELACPISQVEIQSLCAHHHPQNADPFLGETSRKPDGVNALVQDRAKNRIQ